MLSVETANWLAADLTQKADFLGENGHYAPAAHIEEAIRALRSENLKNVPNLNQSTEAANLDLKAGH